MPLLLLLLLLVDPAHALQIVDAQDGQTVLGKISRKEVTRIAFEKGRVRKVTGSAGEFILEKDDEKGQIFVRPVDPQSTKPINLFLTSERGTVALLLQPVDTPSDSIVIREPRSSSAAPSRLEASGRHVRTIKNLLLALADDALPEDMEAREPARDVALWPGTRLTLQRVLLGSGVVGEKYQLTNIGSTNLALAESALFKSGVMAVSVEQNSLRPGEATNLFVIRERKNDD
jgi:conjugal transfer pilus assembly protein TraK